MNDIVYKLNIVFVLIMGGIMTMYCITLGRYFTYLAKNNMLLGFTQYYSKFRKNTNVQKIFFTFFIGQLLFSIYSLIINFRKPLILQILASFGAVVVFIGHSTTGFLKSEESISSGKSTTPNEIENYIKYNVPLHIFYSFYYILIGILLVINS